MAPLMARHHRVWRVRLSIPASLQDPDLPPPRYHNYLFVEDEAETRDVESTTTGTGSAASFSNARHSNDHPLATSDVASDSSAGAVTSGTIHEVTGDLVTGMQYHSRRAGSPLNEPLLHDRTLLGVVDKEDYPEKFEAVCRGQPPPRRQKKFNIRTMRTEPVKSNGEFYQDGEERGRLRKCTEWTEEQVIPALWHERVLKEVVVGDNGRW
ncbi:MAG: hypothetical protein M1831_001300 [Alyxoria varia]|nr:MAG: hypothetical protein M1831_001300 [Alyxoria varia]